MRNTSVISYMTIDQPESGVVEMYDAEKPPWKCSEHTEAAVCDVLDPRKGASPDALLGLPGAHECESQITAVMNTQDCVNTKNDPKAPNIWKPYTKTGGAYGVVMANLGKSMHQVTQGMKAKTVYSPDCNNKRRAVENCFVLTKSKETLKAEKAKQEADKKSASEVVVAKTMTTTAELADPGWWDKCSVL